MVNLLKLNGKFSATMNRTEVRPVALVATNVATVVPNEDGKGCTVSMVSGIKVNIVETFDEVCARLTGNY